MIYPRQTIKLAKLLLHVFIIQILNDCLTCHIAGCVVHNVVAVCLCNCDIEGVADFFSYCYPLIIDVLCCKEPLASTKECIISIVWYPLNHL